MFWTLLARSVRIVHLVSSSLLLLMLAHLRSHFPKVALLFSRFPPNMSLSTASKLLLSRQISRQVATMSPHGSRSVFLARHFSSLNKKDLAKKISEAHDLSAAKSERVLTTVLDTIIESVSNKKPVKLGGFGTFETYTSKARDARNPRTGESLKIPAKERVRFKAFTAFKDIVEGKK